MLLLQVHQLADDFARVHALLHDLDVPPNYGNLVFKLLEPELQSHVFILQLRHLALLELPFELSQFLLRFKVGDGELGVFLNSESTMLFESGDQAIVETQCISLVDDMLGLHDGALLGEGDFKIHDRVLVLVDPVQLDICALFVVQELPHNLVVLLRQQRRDILGLLDQKLTGLLEEIRLELSHFPVVSGLDLAEFLAHELFNLLLVRRTLQTLVRQLRCNLRFDASQARATEHAGSRWQLQLVDLICANFSQRLMSHCRRTRRLPAAVSAPLVLNAKRDS